MIDTPTAVTLTDEQFEDLTVFGIEPAAREKEVSETFDAVAGRVITDRPRPTKMVMFSPQGVRKEIPMGGDAKGLRQDGWSLRCPKCMATPAHRRTARDCPGILHGCPSIPQISRTRCPVTSCRKIIRDYQFQEERTVVSDADAAGYIEITPDMTPEDRLRARLKTHMLAYHHREAEMMFGWTRAQAPLGPSLLEPLAPGDI